MESRRLNQSLKNFPHEGLFYLALDKVITKDIMMQLLLYFGYTKFGEIGRILANRSDFYSILQCQMIVVEEKKDEEIISRDADHLLIAAQAIECKEIVELCIKWHGAY